ncbi:MAG: hypothetical protein JST54_15070 [Deltaproteobacteria bacterium]|nr:hypothetical protein [Deltaproteobacteria bacterium]
MAEQPHLGSLQPGRALGVVFYLLLAVALVVALIGDRLSWLPPAWRALAPAAFGLFLVLFAVYRYVLIRAGRYPFGRAMYQVLMGVLFLVVLLSRVPLAPVTSGDDLGTLLDNADPLVRRLACEVARYRPDGAKALPQLRAHAADDVESVRSECAKSVQALAH